jgi:hypothetical protein
MDWLRKHRPTRFPLQRLSIISGSNDIASTCMSKIYTIFILLIIIEISKVKVNMRFFFLSVYKYKKFKSDTGILIEIERDIVCLIE